MTPEMFVKMFVNVTKRVLSGVADYLPAAIAAILAGFTAYLFSPGFMSQDTINQYAQMIGAIPVTNAHPPSLMFLWRVLRGITGDNAGLLMFHQALYWSAVVLMSRQLHSRLRVRIAWVLFFGLFPSFYILMLHNWKDAAMLSAFLLCVAASLTFAETRKWCWLILSVSMLIYGTSVRHNAQVAVPPLALLIANAATLGLSLERPKLVQLFLGIAITGLTLVSIRAIEWKVDAEYDVASLALAHDFAGMSVVADELLAPGYLFIDETTSDEVRLEQLRRHFDRDINVALISAGVFIQFPPSDAPIYRDWFDTIRANPAVYMRHRLDQFRRLMAFGTPVHYPHSWGIVPNEYDLRERNRSTTMYIAFQRVLNWLSGTWIYKPWPFFGVNFVVILLAARSIVADGSLSGHRYWALLLSSSSVLLMAGLFVFTAASDHRYSVWSTATAFLSVGLMTFRRPRVTLGEGTLNFSFVKLFIHPLTKRARPS